MIVKNRIHEREVHKEHILNVMFLIPILFFMFSLSVNKGNLLEGLLEIAKSPTILVTDFMALGGVSSAFLNASLIGFFNILLIKKFKMRINGLLIAAFMTMLGFSFFGKNLVNIIPLYIGGYLYAKNQGIHMRDVIVVIMFSTGLSPIISELMFADIIASPMSILVGGGVGILIGFVIAPLASHMLKFHDGYNLYNIGFAAGIIGTVFTSIIRTLDKEIMPVSILYLEYDTNIKIFLIFIFLLLIGIGLFINKNGVKEYKNIFKYSGRTVTDFTYLIGYGATFLNMGLMGLSSVLLVVLLKGIINGPVMAAIFTIVGFSAFGKHPKNCIPVVSGVFIAALLLGLDVSSTGIIISILFSTTIAPIAGAHGPIIGFMAGLLHLALVTNIGVIHGGINLYNNGFSGGLVAGVLIPIIDAFKRGE